MKYLLPITLFLFLAGCSQIGAGSDGFESLQETEARYLRGGTIGPVVSDSLSSSINNITLMERELDALRAKSSAEVQELIDLRIELLEFDRQYLEAEMSRRKISIAKGGCNEQDPLKTTIDRLGKALEKAPSIRERIRNAQRTNSLYKQSNISSTDFEKFVSSLETMKEDMEAFYQKSCVG